MTNFSSEKQLSKEYMNALNIHDLDAVNKLLALDILWRGFHPFGELKGAQDIIESFWLPLFTAVTGLKRRQDVFFAGRNQIDQGASTWVVSMGHLMGLFDHAWLNIAPTGKMIFLRYCEFMKIENGQLSEIAMYFDIPHFMMQAGLNPFPPQTGAHLVQPGPATHNGLLYDDAPHEEGEKTREVINKMISDLGTWQLGLPLEQELARTWHDDMIWWGPAGIGATYTIERYAKQHAGPFRAAFTNRSKTNHICRVAEGHFGGFFGWPNFTAEHTGGFMGMPATQRPGEMRVIDIYRREGDKLKENWIFIDLLHFWNQHGVDILKRCTSI